MTLRYSVAARNDGLDARIKRIGPTPLLRLFGGAEPGNCAAPDPTSLLVEITLPQNWITKASDGAATKQGIWTGVALADGTPECFRIYDAGGVCHLQGSMPTEMQLDSPKLLRNQNFSVAVFVINSGNA